VFEGIPAVACRLHVAREVCKRIISSGLLVTMLGIRAVVGSILEQLTTPEEQLTTPEGYMGRQ
jgi:hypothetical protein